MLCNIKLWYFYYDSMDYILNLWLFDGFGGIVFYIWNGYYCGEIFFEI